MTLHLIVPDRGDDAVAPTSRLTAAGADPARWQDRRTRPLTMRDYRAIRRRLSIGESHRRIANALNVRIGMVRWLAKGVRMVEVRDA